MDEIRLTYLFYRQLQGLTTETEKHELGLLLSKEENEQYVRELIENEWAEFEPQLDVFTSERSEAILQEILRQTTASSTMAEPVYEIRPQRSYFNWSRISIAASIIVTLGISLYLLRPKNEGETASKAELTILTPPGGSELNDVVPGGNKAVLALADGTIISLDSSSTGELAQQGSAKVDKLHDGQLVYTVSGSPDTEVFYNRISTPNGGQYKVILSDGTSVWLNAASSIKYPAVFIGQERKVEITGEVYFEVQKKGTMPFVVTVNGMEVKVLGTHFNINAYDDESAIKTTLLEGSVRVKKNAASKFLKPGDQAVLKKDGVLQVGKVADTDDVIAWKNGMFHFSKATSLESIMKQLARWYDVTIAYKGKIPAQSFGGEVSRSSSLSEVLTILNTSGVDFRIEGKKIIVGK